VCIKENALLLSIGEERPALDRVLLSQVFQRWLVVSRLLEEASTVPREFVQLIHQDIPLLLREVAQLKPDLWEGQ
jgi:hypothetical protein